MIDQKTFESAKLWCKTGADWVDKGAHSTGMRYLDQAIAVFEEVGDLSWLTYARHQKLQALKGRDLHEEAEALGEDVLRGYALLDDAYGKALALSHSAESMARLGRRETATARLNLAAAVAERAGHPGLRAYVLMQLGHLFQEANNALQAIRLYREAEAIFQRQGLDGDAAASRFAAAEVLVGLSERAEAAALLEDVQSHFFGKKQYRQALKPLSLLLRLYEQAGMWDDKNRVGELIHFCGQYILRGEGETPPAQGPRVPPGQRG
jgi:tetratricopeptide (TPR) repeat protein